MMNRQCRQLWVVVLLPVLLLGCGDDEPDGPKKARANAPCVLLITLDTTRADRLGCYGHEAAQTPALDALAASGVRFEQAFCQVPLTLPSHASMLTGTYPATNGVRVNGAVALGKEIPTLAELFQRRGYRTAAFVSTAVLDGVFGLDRGFDVYDDNMTSDGAGGGSGGERRGDVACDAALQWLSQPAEAPFFAWVHLFDAHDPYEPPEPFRSRLADAYDGEIAFADSQVGRLLDLLVTRKLRDRTLVVVAGDHGEAFEEHGEVRHGLLIYATTMQVPLILSYPSVLPGSRVVTSGVRLIDVFPTVVELMGWDAPAELEGMSLVGACKSGEMTFLPVYGESEYSYIGYGWSPLRSLTTRRWKYIQAPTPELYDRTTDAGELVNLAGGEPKTVSTLRAQLLSMIEQMKPRATGSVAPDAEMRRLLEGLGYVGGSSGGAAPQDIGSLRDPKEMLSAYRMHMKASAALLKKHYPQVLEFMAPLVERSPESDEFHVTLGRAYLGLGRGREAQEAFEASLRRVPNHPGPAVRTGGCAETSGQG